MDSVPGLLEEARDLLPQVIELRRAIHRRPELGLHLPCTQRTILSDLERLSDEVEIATGTATTSVTATLRGPAGAPAVLLRCDMDALPMPEDTGLPFASEVDGVMHSCGHDAHAAMLLGAIRLLLARRGQLRGTVRFMFQPGEEGYHGARHMLDEGVLDDPPIDAAFALHVSPNLTSGWVGTRPGPMLASADQFSITVHGRGGHASMPHLANDPIPPACEIVQALQTFMTRRIDAFSPSIVTVASIVAGTTDNVIPETAELAGTIRTVSQSTRFLAHDGIRQVAEGVAAAHGMKAEVRIQEGYPATVNDDLFAELISDVGAELLGEDRVVHMTHPVMGAEDFSYVLQRVPGAMAFLGVCPPDLDPATAPACHSNRMRMDEGALAVGVAFYAAVAIRYLERSASR
jgi:hippurate hydrolase